MRSTWFQTHPALEWRRFGISLGVEVPPPEVPEDLDDEGLQHPPHQGLEMHQRFQVW